MAVCLCTVAVSSFGGRRDRAGERKDYWLARYLSVSYPLRRIVVNSAYGKRRDPVTREVKSHGGIDLAADYEDVYAMFDGVVEAVGSDGRSGNYITVRHGCYTVSYCHLSRRFVEKGEEVTAGMPVAVSGSTGRSTGAHLHLTARKDGAVVDPGTLLDFIDAVRAECIEALGGRASAASAAAFEGGCEAFLEHYSGIAMEHQRQFGIPASVTLSQMAHESKFGRSELARKGRNFFGIKCSRKWLAEGRPYSVHDDDRKGEKFCNYGTAEESVEHHSRLLMSDRYRKCRSCSSTDYHGWLSALKQAGYATDRDYVPLCERIIKRYRLHRYDEMAAA